MLWLHRSAACCHITLPAATHCRVQGGRWLRHRRRQSSPPCATSSSATNGSRDMSGQCAAPGAAQPPASTTIDSSFLDVNSSNWTAQLHLVVLNYHLPNCVARLWPHAVTRVCADGGANRLYDQLPAMLPHLDPTAARSSLLPDVIRGDMDSLRPDVHQFYSSWGVLLQDASDDQDTTDMVKCLHLVQQRIQSLSSHSSSTTAAAAAVAAAAAATSSSTGHQQQQQQQQQQQHSGTLPEAPAVSSTGGGVQQQYRGAKHRVLVLGALGGRLDHTVANLNALYMFSDMEVVLMGEGNLVRLLPTGTTTITPHPLEGPSCGLVPLAAPAVASSSGLRWNLENTQMGWRGLISTSNQIVAPQVVVTSNEQLLWITEVQADSQAV